MRNHFAQLFLMGKRSEVVCFFHRATRGFMVFIRKEPIDWKAYLGTLAELPKRRETIKNHTTGLRPWKCNSSVSYNNFCVICALTIIVNRYTSHHPFQGKVKGHQLPLRGELLHP